MVIFDFSHFSEVDRSRTLMWYWYLLDFWTKMWLTPLHIMTRVIRSDNPGPTSPLRTSRRFQTYCARFSISFLLDHHLPTVCFHMFCLQSLNKQTLRHNTSAEIYPCEVGRWSLPFTNPQPPTDPRDLACPLRNPPVGTRELFQHHKLLLVPLPAPGSSDHPRRTYNW